MVSVFVVRALAAILALAASACGGERPHTPATETAAPGAAAASGAGAAPGVGAASGAGTASAAGAVVARPAGDLVDVAAVIPDAILDLRYATADNLTGAPIYPVARCLLHRDVAARLARAAAALRRAGHRLVLWDCYRPASAQRLLWARVGDPRYVAAPRDDARGRPIAGSVHSRGAAVDVSLADAGGAPRVMPTDHDHFGPAAHRDRPAADPSARAHAAALEAAMTAAGFRGLPTEWWHYDAPEGARLPLLDVPLH